MGITGTGNGGVLVAPPSCVPSKYGLLSVAEVEDRPDGHWMAGIEYELETCEDLFVLTPKCNQLTQDLDPKDATGGNVSFDNFADPFTMVAAYECGTVGRALSEAWEHAEIRLDRGENRTIERTFWTGKDRKGNAIRQSLGENSNVVDLTPVAGALSISDGLATLESWAGDEYPCQPILHAQRGLAVYMGQSNVIRHDNDEMRVVGTGSRVVVGGGYTASGPMGNVPAPGESWLFVTGSIKVNRGPKFFTPDRGEDAAAVDRVVNDVTVFAERTYAIQQDCIVGAVRVILQSCC